MSGNLRESVITVKVGRVPSFDNNNKKELWVLSSQTVNWQPLSVSSHWAGFFSMDFLKVDTNEVWKWLSGCEEVPAWVGT